MEVQNMKKAKRLLAVLLASLMLFTAASVPSYAYISGDNWHVANDTGDQKYYFDYAQGASWVLDFLDDMLLDLGVCINCDELNELVDIGINIFTSNVFLNTDARLEEAGCVDETGQGALDLRSVDNLIKSLYGLLDNLNDRIVDLIDNALVKSFFDVLGDLLDTEKGLQMTGLDPKKLRGNGVTSDREVLEMLVLWITNQKGLLRAILGNDFNWGSLLPDLIGGLINDLLDPVQVEFDGNNKLNTNKLIKDLLYNLLIDSTAASAPANDANTPEDESSIDSWVQHLIDMLVITGTGDGSQEDDNLTHPVYGDGANSILGADAKPLMSAVGQFEGGASITGISVYQFVNNIINGLFGGTLKDLLADLLYDLLEIEITPEHPYGDPAVLQDQTFTMIVGIVEGLFVDNGAPAPSYTDEENSKPTLKVDALLDWLLVGDPANGVDSALDTFLLIDYYGFHIQDNFMSLLNDVARLLINLLPSLGLFADSAHLAYTPDELTVSYYIDENFNLVDSNSESKVTQTYVTYETNEIVYPTEFITDANNALVPVAYCYLDDKSAVNTTDATAADYMNPSLIRPNYVITTKMVFANIIKLAINDFIDGCYFPEWTTDIPSVLAYGFAAMAAPVVPENNYYARLDAYYQYLQGGVAPLDGTDTIQTANGDELDILRYSIYKVITVKDINGNVAGTANVEIPKAALDIIASFGAKRLNGVFHFDTDVEKFTTDTTFERFLGEFLLWAVTQYMPAFVGEATKKSDGKTQFIGNNDNTDKAPIFASTLETYVNTIYNNYEDYIARKPKVEANWDAVYDLVDGTLFKLLPTSWLPHINGSAQFINQWLLENLINFNLQGILNLFQVNEDPSAELNNSLVKVIINVLDRVLALVFNDNGVMITSGKTTNRTGVVMNNDVTTLSTLAGLLDCSSKDASVPMLVYNLLNLLNVYKAPLLGTILPLILGGEYIKPYSNAYGTKDNVTTFFPNGAADLKKYKIADLENYMSDLYDHTNAYCIKELDSLDDAEAALAQGEDKPMAIKNADGVRTDILLSTGNTFGTYASRDEANQVLELLKNSYIHEELVNEATGTYKYHIYTNESYLTSANGTPASDDAGDYTKYSDFSFSQLTYRTIADPLVSYDDDYRFFQYEDFGKSGFLYNNHKDAVDGGHEFVDSYYSFVENDLVNAYGEWYMYFIESQLKSQSLLDTNGDGVGNADDGEPSIPTAMYPYATTAATQLKYYDVDAYTLSDYDYDTRTKDGFIDSDSGTVITDHTMASFNAENFEQLALALEYAAETDADGKPIHNVVLSDEDAESVVRLAIGSLNFDITRNGDGEFNGPMQWEHLVADSTNMGKLNTWCANNGFTFTTTTAEDGSTVYQLARPAFALIGDTTFSYSNISTIPELDFELIMEYIDHAIDSTQTYGEELVIAIHQGYFEYIKALYANRNQLLDEIDELSWRVENAENGRKSTGDPTVLKWVLDLVADDYKNPQTRKRNITYIQDENGNNVESKQFTTSSYTKFRNAYDFANDLYDAVSDANILASGITQSMITAAYQGLLEAWMALVEFTGFADWTQIHYYITIAEEILNDPYVQSNDPDFGVASGLTELEAALKDAYVYADNHDNPETAYDLNKNSESKYDSENNDDIYAAAALLNQAIQSLVYNKIPSILPDPDGTNVKIQDTKYENQIQYAHIYGLTEGVGFGDGSLEIDDVLDMLGLKVTGITIDGDTGTVTRSNSSFGSGTNARIDGRYQNYLRFRYFAVIYGDINGDTRIDNTDASALRIYISKNENKVADMGEARFEAADVTHDGGVDVADVQAIVNHYSLVKDGEIKQDEHSPVATVE